MSPVKMKNALYAFDRYAIDISRSAGRSRDSLSGQAGKAVFLQGGEQPVGAAQGDVKVLCKLSGGKQCFLRLFDYQNKPLKLHGGNSCSLDKLSKLLLLFFHFLFLWTYKIDWSGNRIYIMNNISAALLPQSGFFQRQSGVGPGFTWGIAKPTAHAYMTPAVVLAQLEKGKDLQ